MTNPEPVAIVTGASSGIGLELARCFARHGHRTLLVARSGDRLAALADELVAQGFPRPLPLALDLAHADAGLRIDEELARHGLEPQFVVNNAGFGLAGLAETQDRAEQLDMIDLNVRSLTDLSLRWIESLTRQRGGLMNVASVAGFVPGPGAAVYYATKAYVVSFTQALHQEWKPRGIRVTALCPGPVPSGFQARAGVPDRKLPPLATVSAGEVAEQGFRGLMQGRRLVVPGLANKALVSFAPMLPTGFVLSAAERRARRRSH